MNPTEETRQIIAKVKAFISKTPWKEAFETRLDVLSERASMPCELAIAGRVKAGRQQQQSTILNMEFQRIKNIQFLLYGKMVKRSGSPRLFWTHYREIQERL